jgi:hypothetical protein
MPKSQNIPAGSYSKAQADARYTKGDVANLTTAGAALVSPGVGLVILNNAAAISASIVDASQHKGYFVAKQTDAGTAGHTITLTSGTWDGTNTIATFNAQDEMLEVYFDENGDGTLIRNTGAVALS